MRTFLKVFARPVSLAFTPRQHCSACGSEWAEAARVVSRIPAHGRAGVRVPAQSMPQQYTRVCTLPLRNLSAAHLQRRALAAAVGAAHKRDVLQRRRGQTTWGVAGSMF